VIQKEESDDNLIAEKLKVFEKLINEYSEMRKNFTGNDQQFQITESNEKLFQDNPELFFSVDKLQALNIHSLIYTGIFSNTDFPFSEKVILVAIFMCVFSI
jgi:hypothetical protein